MITHLHHYVNGVCAGHGAKPAPCGEVQVYRPPTGRGREFSDVLVDKGDLLELIGAYQAQAAMPDAGADALCERLLELIANS